MNAEHCKAYTLLQEQQIDDIHAHGYLLRHNKSGARVLLLENEDDNKVFNIAFRTPFDQTAHFFVKFRTIAA